MTALRFGEVRQERKAKRPQSDLLDAGRNGYSRREGWVGLNCATRWSLALTICEPMIKTGCGDFFICLKAAKPYEGMAAADGRLSCPTTEETMC